MKNKVKVKLRTTSGTIQPPEYATDGAVGIDLRARHILKVFRNEFEMPFQTVDDLHITKTVFKIPALCRVLIGTGIKVAVPEGYEIQIRSRSGLALKQGLFVANQPGTIDPDYRGEIGVILHNSNERSQTITLGERIAQAVLCPVAHIEWEEVEELPDTKRSYGGFGSTDKI